MSKLLKRLSLVLLAVALITCSAFCILNATTKTHATEQCQVHDWSNKNGICKVCGFECEEHLVAVNFYKLAGDSCIFDKETHECTICGFKCTHVFYESRAFQNGRCVICGMKECENHDWSNKDGVCKDCYKKCNCFEIDYFGGEIEVDNEQQYIDGDSLWGNRDGVCKECGRTCSHSKINDEGVEESLMLNGYCSHCGYVCKDHDYSNNDGVCKTCNYHCLHHHLDEKNHCTECGVDFTPKIIIDYCNLDFLNEVNILLLARYEDEKNLLKSNNLKIAVWTNGNGVYNVKDEDHIDLITENNNFPFNGKVYFLFRFNKFSAKQMGDYFYFKAYCDGYESPVLKYSVLTYAQNVKGVDADLDEYMSAVLTYGAESQKFFSYNTSRLVDDTYYKLTANGATLGDGTKYGLFKANDQVTLYARDGRNSTWTVNGQVVASETNNITVTVKGTTTVLADIEEYHTVTFEYDDVMGYVTYNGEKVTTAQVKYGENVRVNGNSITIGEKTFYSHPSSSDFSSIPFYSLDVDPVVTKDFNVKVYFEAVGQKTVTIKTEDEDKGCILYTDNYFNVGEMLTDSEFSFELYVLDDIQIDGSTIIIARYQQTTYKAIPKEGYVFDCWVYETLTVLEDMSLTAKFKKADK